MALDGNSIAGMLVTLFGTEMTTATVACAACGTRSLVGELAVYLRGPGTVVRCRHCGDVVMIFVEAHGVTCVDLRGLGPGSPSARRAAGGVACVPFAPAGVHPRQT